ASACLPREVPQARYRAAAGHVRRARPLARRGSGRNRVKRRLPLTIASAAVAALALPTLALAQGPAPTLSDETTSGFPDKAFLVTLPSTQALTASKLQVTENGQPVMALGVAPPGGDKSGAILLLDASNSMKGAPIQNAM